MPDSLNSDGGDMYGKLTTTPRAFAQSPLLTSLAMIVLGLTSCAEPRPEPRLLAEPAALQVEKTAATHTILVNASGQASASERQRLNGFIAAIGADRPESLHITVSGPQSEQRLRNVSKLLVADGVVSKKITLVSGTGDRPGAIKVAVERYVVRPPQCPEWSAEEVAGFDNTTRSNFGCANLANFAAMLADPRDLLAPRYSPYGDGTVGAAAIERYQTDKLKELPRRNENFTVGTAAGAR
jgi:pilus assembly protein CpaD